MDRVKVKQAFVDFVTKYKFAVLVFTVGLLLMILPDAKDAQQPEIKQDIVSAQKDSMDEKLSEILSCVNGAGQVQVMLSYEAGPQTVYQTDWNVSEGEKSKSEKVDTVTVTDSARNQTGLIQRIDPPICMGALIVCQGADNPSVKLAIVEAVTRITGLSSDKICVLKMK